MKSIDIGLAIRAIIEICKEREYCEGCPINGICIHGSPLEWDISQVPEIGELIAIYVGERERGDSV